MDKDILYKQHILDAVAKIEQYVAGVSHENFLGNTMLQDAVVHELQIIGEAAKRLSPSFKKSMIFHGVELPEQEIRLFTIIFKLTWKLFGPLSKKISLI